MRRSFVPVILIGAGRSGTKILRDSLATLPGVGTWPCDEINYVWRHGNARHPHDELSPEHATPEVRRYIRRMFAQLAKRRGLDLVLEKTCANSLRVAFVHEIFPEAKFIFLVRDGRDVAVSARRRWRGHLDIPYLLRKARYVPLIDLPYYAGRYLRNRIQRLLSNERRLAFWGPRFDGMEALARTADLLEVCAWQWRHCVEKARGDLATLPPEQVLQLHYEDFVDRPQQELLRLGQFLEIDIPPDSLRAVAQQVDANRTGVWRRVLGEAERQAIRPILQETLHRLGYDSDI